MPKKSNRNCSGGGCSGSHSDPASEIVQFRRNSLHQILQTQQHIFKVSPTFEEMYLYKFNPNTNEVIKVTVLKRVKDCDSGFEHLCSSEEKRIHGRPSKFRGINYRIFKLCSRKPPLGYMLRPDSRRNNSNSGGSEEMYFAFDKK